MHPHHPLQQQHTKAIVDDSNDDIPGVVDDLYVHQIHDIGRMD